MPQADQKGTIVFVHGAWCDGSAWTQTLLPLAHEGFRVHTAQLPLQTFHGDIAALTGLIDRVESPVLLVGHSYGGAVVSATGDHPKVKAIAYVTALVPEADEILGALLAMNHAPAQQREPDAQGFLWIDADYIARDLGQDLHPGAMNLLAATQKPTHVSIFGASLPDPAWKHKPSAYLITTEDRVLAPATQHTLAQRINARIEEVPASHLVLFSQPEAVANFVRTSALTLQP